MKRSIIQIDEEKCNGCGLCVPNCAEGALQIIDGKARLVGDILCDGLGACLGHCPQGALTIEEREAVEFDEKAVHEHLKKEEPLPCGCPSTAMQTIKPQHGGCPGSAMRTMTPQAAPESRSTGASELTHWPVQLRLVPPNAPFLKNADLVICADCVPFAVPDFHARYLFGRAVVIGCPKLDDVAYYKQKLVEMFKASRPMRVTVLRMEVPCCGGLAQIALEARAEAIPDTPLEVHVIGIQGGITRIS